MENEKEKKFNILFMHYYIENSIHGARKISMYLFSA